MPTPESCSVCRNRTHAKWHDLARGEINPVALIEFVEGFKGNQNAVLDAIIGWVYAVTGMNAAEVKQALREEREAEKDQ